MANWSSMLFKFDLVWLVQFSCSVMSDSLQPHGLPHTRLPCPSPTSRAHSNSCPSSLWCHAKPSHPLSPYPPAFSLAQHQGLFQWVSSSHQGAKVLELQLQHQSFQLNIQDWFPLGWTGLTSLLSKEVSRVFFNTTVWKHQFFGIQSSLWSKSQNFFWIELSLQLVSHNCSNNVTISYILMLKLLNVTNKLLIGNASFNDNRVFLPISLYFHGWI